MSLKYLIKKIFIISFSVIAILLSIFTIFFFIHVDGVSLSQRIKGNFSRFEPGINPGQTLLRFRNIEKFNQVDILFSGSSHAMRGFDPRIFEEENLTSYNIASASQTPLNSYYLIKKYISKLKPKIVIFELYPNVLENDGYESYIDLITNLDLSKELFEMAISLKSLNSIISLYEVFIKRINYPLESEKQKKISNEKYIDGGYVEIYEERNKEDKIPNNKKIKISPKQIEYVKKIIKISKENNADILIVTHPLPKDYISSITNYNQLSRKIKNIIEAEGAVYIDFNNILDLGSYDNFMDSNHLNFKGVRLFNDALINEMKNHQIYNKYFYD